MFVGLKHKGCSQENKCSTDLEKLYLYGNNMNCKIIIYINKLSKKNYYKNLRIQENLT